MQAVNTQQWETVILNKKNNDTHTPKPKPQINHIDAKLNAIGSSELPSDIQNKMGWPSFHGIYMNLFINGLYWGMYDLHERPDEDFMEEYLDADKEEFDIIKHNPNTIVAGTNAAYLEMLEVARKGVIGYVGFKNIQKYLDLPAFIDYMILNFYLGNFDWVHQNYYAATE